MRRENAWCSAALALLLLTAGCSLLEDLTGRRPAPTPPFAATNPTLMPAAEVTFRVAPPQNSPAGTEIALVLLDVVTGLPYNSNTLPMSPLADGRWELKLTPPLGSLLHYRYSRRSPAAADEQALDGRAVRYRTAHISGPIQFDDVVGAWADIPYEGGRGRIIGRVVDAQTGSPLPEILVSAGGLTSFADGLGSFRIDDLPPGLHNLVAYSPDGAYRTAQQGAIVADGSTTPAQLAMAPAQPVQVTFEVTVPGDTIEGTPVRLAGNLRQLGHVFADLTGGVTTSTARMPTLIEVDPTHYLLITDLFQGTDLRYKYTLGDGLWNAERDSLGFFVTRQTIVGGDDLVIRDVVQTWRTRGLGNVMFQVTVPADTPPNDKLSIQFNPFTWFEPLPMWRLGQDEWFFMLHGPLDFTGSIGYRYCRNQACGGADDMETAGSAAVGRQFSAAVANQDLRDNLRGWQWLGAELPATTIVAPEITPRAGFEAGVEIVPAYSPNWGAFINQALLGIADLGANAVILTPGWILARSNPTPILAIDPAHTPFSDELRATIFESTGHGLQVVLHPSLRTLGQEPADWWLTAPRDSGWWTTWFDSYRSFVMTFARIATETRVAKLVLGGTEIAPSLPGGTLSDGSPSGVPADAANQWESLITQVRSVYPGRLAFEIELATALQTPPPFLQLVDEVHIYWHAPLGSGNETTFAEMQATAHRLIQEQLLNTSLLSGKPIVLSVEYLAFDGAATSCAGKPNGGCFPAEAFDFGADPDPAHAVDLAEQAQAINAVILEAYSQPAITGFYVRRYHPIVALQDKSASVNGKPARDVLWHWYPRILGQ